jgi:hypothetical protein
VQEGPVGNPPSYEAIRMPDALYIEYGAPENDAAFTTSNPTRSNSRTS